MTPELQRPHSPGPRKRVRKEMLINAIPPEEVRIAILENGVLEELYVERSTQESFVGNIYRGKIVNIEPSIQAAFVDFGVGRNGFLHVSDVDPQYYRHLTDGDSRSRKDGLLDILDIPEISAEEEAALEASAQADDDQEEEAPPPPVEVIEDASDEEVTLDEEPPHRSRDYRSRGEDDRGPRRGGYRDRGRRDDDFGRDRRGSRGPRDRYRRDDDRRGPPPMGAPRGETQISEPAAAPPPPPQNVTESAASGSGFGFGILMENNPQEIAPLPPAIATEPAAEQESTSTSFTPTPSQGYDRYTTNQSSFDMEDFSFSPRREPARDREPAHDREPAPQTMPSAERLTSAPEQPEQVQPTRSDWDDFAATTAEPDSQTTSSASEDSSLLSDFDVSFSKSPTEPAPIDSFNRGEEPESVLPTFDADAFMTSPESDFSSAFEEEGQPDNFSASPELEERSPTPAEEPQSLRGDEPITFDDEPPPGEESAEEPQRQYRDRRPRRGGDRYERGGDRDRGPRRGGFNQGGFNRGGDRRPRGPSRDFGRDGPNAPPKPPIQEIFRRGQEVLVQVIKEGIGTKGPTLSTYISIPGRYLVVMPGLSRIGVSRKIGDEQQRRRLRTILQDLQPPRGLGFIIRTAGLDRTKKELQRDLAYLTRLWRVIANRIKKSKGPAPIYQESDIITRTIRDIFTNEIEKIRVDEPVSYGHAREFMEFVMPRYADRLFLEQGLEPIFHRFGIESEIGNIQHKRVPLNNGGSLIIEQAEALVAIDVNSGQFRQESDAEENAFQMNLAAAKEVARQLRLRDLGGVIVIDFIDMRDERHRHGIERALRLAVSRDRARTKILRMSQFGIIQMTRQRIRPSLKRTSFNECPACRATGLVKTGETVSIEVMRLLQLAAWRPNVSRVRLRVAENVAQFLLNRKRRDIAKIEDDGNIQITILGVPNAMPETMEIQCLDASGGEMRLGPVEHKPKRSTRN